MEMMLRCALPDRPGSLARLAGAIGEVGADIEAVEVVAVEDGRALDDLVVVVDGATQGQALLERLEGLPDIEVVMAQPSRGHPGDGVARAAVGIEALLTGSAEPDRGIVALVGGLMRAEQAEIVDDPPAADRKRLVLACGRRWLVVERSHRFTDVERQRAEALARVGVLAAGAAIASAS